MIDRLEGAPEHRRSLCRVEHHHHSVIGVGPALCHAANRSAGAVESRRGVSDALRKSQAAKSISLSEVGQIAKKHHDPIFWSGFSAKLQLAIGGLSRATGAALFQQLK